MDNEEQARRREYKLRREYYGLTQDYFYLMKESSQFSEALLFFSEKVLQLLTDGFVSSDELKRILGEDFEIASRKLPWEHQSNIFEGLTREQIEDMKQAAIELDRKRNRLHREVLEFAFRNFRKNSLDVFIDIMQHNELSPLTHRLNIYAPPKKEGVFITQLGVIETTNLTYEVDREYGEDFKGRIPKERWHDRLLKETIKSAQEGLRRLRKEEKKFPFLLPIIRYKSFIKEGRTEKEDNRASRAIRTQFPEYVSFSGDYWYKTAHGHSYFTKIVEFSLDRILETNSNPEGEVERIQGFLRSLVPRD